jgi:hypothetical protein
MSKINYFLCFYNEKNIDRKRELYYCLNEVLQNEKIDFLGIILEEDVELEIENEKINKFLVKARPTYNDIFNIANLASTSGDFIIIANTDIYPESRALSFINHLRFDQCFALSRWDIQKDGSIKHWARGDSQDVWIFRAPVRKVNANFFMGIPGCDNRLASELQVSGYQVTNPSSTVKFNHLHLSGVRNYDRQKGDLVPPPYLHITPTT